MKTDERKQMLVRFDPDLHAWLLSESEASGRSATWLVEHACQLWRKRIERERKKRKIQR